MEEKKLEFERLLREFAADGSSCICEIMLIKDKESKVFYYYTSMFDWWEIDFDRFAEMYEKNE